MTAATAIDLEAAQSLAPFSLKDAHSFIEAQFPVGRLSAEAFKERDAKQAQTLTGLGSYWIGRKPLILVRAVVLGTLLPTSDDPAKDLEIFLKLMAIDDAAFLVRLPLPDHEVATRALAAAALSKLELPLHFRIRDSFWKAIDRPEPTEKDWEDALEARALVLETDEVTERRLRLAALSTLSYVEKVQRALRPEECDQAALLAHIFPEANQHLGTNAGSLDELVEQLGIARFGHRPKVGDTFCGGGSIPFEAARAGCDAYASDLNPVACMLSWGAFNIVGASPEKRIQIESVQKEVAAVVDAEITQLGIEHDKRGNRAKAYLYCLETRCPKTGWMVPILPTLVISKTKNIVAKLRANGSTKTYDIVLHANASPEEMVEAGRGTVHGGRLVHPMNPERSGVELKTIRGDFRDASGVTRNRLRLWEKLDFVPRPEDIWQERLYAIQWITRETLNKGRQKTFFAAVTDDDLARERQVEAIVRKNLGQWQEVGFVPDMPIEPGDKTDEPIRTRGWTYWHHLFCARQLLYLAKLMEQMSRHPEPSLYISLARTIDWTTKLCRYGTGAARESISQTFDTMALDPLLQYGVRSSGFAKNYFLDSPKSSPVHGEFTVANHSAVSMHVIQDIYITDPPYADAVVYHEITEFFIAWLRRNPPAPFDQWTWDSQRSLAIKGRGEVFRRDMVSAYDVMTRHMLDNGLQVVMFTHQDADVWADLGAILWASGLSVRTAWNVVTETEKPSGKGNYVQGTVCLVLRKRLNTANARRMEIEAEIEEAVTAQLSRLTALDDTWHERANAETLYTDGDLTLAAYAAALQVVTSYSSIDRQPLDRDLYRKLDKGERTMIRDLVDYAAQVANGLLVPMGFPREAWRDLGPAERFYVRMLDMEAKGATKVADFQNFAKSFAYGDYASVMASTAANAASLAGAADLKGKMLDGEGFAKTQLRQVLFAVWKTLEKGDPKLGVTTLRTEYPADYWQRRQKLIGLAEYLAAKTKNTRPTESAAAHELTEALKLDRV